MVNDVGDWSFEELQPRQVRRDPFEAEFFTGEDDEERDGSRTDALVRETLQNSLDARQGHEPIHVRFGIDRLKQVLEPSRVGAYFGGLAPHLRALGNTVVEETAPVDYLVIEDFGTTGLIGDVSRMRDPGPEASGGSESFYWFWRNVGRSGKGGSNRGRWGLGKTVYPSASRINAFLGLTCRSDDHRTLLMGQAITKIHTIGNTEYLSEGFFSAHDPGAQIQMPIHDASTLEQFKRDFTLERRPEQTGLSLVIPYPIGVFRADDISRSVILHFFIPILMGELTVEVDGDGPNDVTITRETIERVARAIPWDGAAKHKLHQPPPFELARWAIARQRSNNLPESLMAGASKSPQWGEGLFDSEELQKLRETFGDSGRIALRVPISIETRTEGRKNSRVDFFLEKTEDGRRAEDYFVREGMTISGISTLSGVRGLRGIALVDQGELSRLLGDAEGPTHTEWGTGEARPEERYERWKRRVTFVRTGIKKLHALLTPPPDELEVDWLVDMFAISTEANPKRKRKTTGPKVTGEPEVVVAPRPKPFQLLREPGGFRIESVTGQQPPEQLKVVVAYDLPRGNPLGKWSHFDFSFERAAASGLSIQASGAQVTEQRKNELIISIDSPEFEVDVRGFDRNRDLFCKVNAIGGES